MASSSSERRLVSVSRPTALEGQTFLPVPGQDLNNVYVRNVHVIPGPVDVERFEAALSKSLARYPHMAGRFVRKDDDWQINLTNDPVPVIVASSSETAHPFPDDFVIQPTSLTDGLGNMDDANKMFLKGEGTESLLVIKLTISPTWTAIAVAFCHVLGDAQAYHDFTVSLSKYYEDINTPESQLPLAPDFYRHVFPPPWDSPPISKENMLPRMPHLAQDYDIPGMYRLYGDDLSTTEEIQFRVSSESLSKIHESAKAGNEGTFLSVHDAMSAYLTTALSRTFDKPITKVINVVNYRWPAKLIDSAPKFAHPAASANCVYDMHSERIPVDRVNSVPYIAKVIRDSIQLARQPDFIEKWFSFGSWLMARAANTERFHYFPPHDEWQAIKINSNYRFDWNKAHFGYPGQASFHTAWSSRSVLRIFDCNPTAVTSSSGPKPADISLLVKKEKKPILIEIISKDYPDTIFQQTTMKLEALSDLEIVKKRD